jgi:hypothetical protein
MRYYQFEAIYCLIDYLLGSNSRNVKRVNEKLYAKSLQVVNI